MPEMEAPRMTKWPFILADLVLVGMAGFIILTATWPLSRWEIMAAAPCVIVGCWIGLIPFLREHSAAVKLWEQANLAAAARQLSAVSEVAEQIRLATGQWQGIQDTVSRTAASSTAAAEKVSAETKAFSEFLSRTNDQEKAALKLEIDKMRRGHTEHLQVIVHTLDHIHALYQAGCRSGIPAVVEQLGQFRSACLDAARRIGLAVYEARPGDPFDPQSHQTPDGQTPPAGSIVEATIACGLTYQGQPLRRILVALQGGPVTGSTAVKIPAETNSESAELPLVTGESGPLPESAG